MFPSTQTNTLHDNGGIETKYMGDDSWTKLIFDNLANADLRYTTKPVMNHFRR